MTMRRYRALIPLCLALVFGTAHVTAFASTAWQQPTPDELSMKSYPADPSASAVYLYREEKVDDDRNFHTVYARIKILTEKGKETFGDIEIRYIPPSFKVDQFEGRTIQSNGDVVPFTGQPYDKLIEKEGDIKIMAKAYSMPDVQIGSIIEYRYRIKSDSEWRVPPDWHFRQSVPVLKANYNFAPMATNKGLIYSLRLPTGEKVVKEKDGSLDLMISNIPALPDEEFLPPIGNSDYRLIFYYSDFKTPDAYWRVAGNDWSQDFDRFAKASGKIRDAVNGIVTPADTDQQKVQKIYAAIMKLENTSFTREHTAKENKAQHLKVNTAQDIWAQQRGSDDEITRLFVAMVRAAGLKAYGAAVANRNESVFYANYLSWNQLDDELAIVSIGGKEVYFDPGQRYCEFGKLHWKHTWATGVRQTDDGKTEIFSTPGPDFRGNVLERTARLTLDPNDQLAGLLYETMTGAEALAWRQDALSGDEAGTKKRLEERLQSSMPSGVQVKVTQLVGLTDLTIPLKAVINVSGTLGTQTGKHIFIPAVLLDAGSTPLFAETHRENDVDMHFPYAVRDEVQLTLPTNFTVENLPGENAFTLPSQADYTAKFISKGNIFAYGRRLRVASVYYKAADYPALHGFFQKVSSDDQEQVALTVAPLATTAKTASTAPGAER